MIEHGADELLALASSCSTTEAREVAGWVADRWILDESQVEQLAVLYDKTLLGGTDDEWNALLESTGLPISELLVDSEHAKDDLTRADMLELASVAALIEMDGWPLDLLEMPNSPQRNRGRSESGVDALAVRLLRNPHSSLILDETEQLYISSTKHSILRSLSDIHRKLLRSVDTKKELTQPYIIRELRVFHRRLSREGYSQEERRRIYLFARDWPNFTHVSIFAAAGIDASLDRLVDRQLDRLPEMEPESHYWRYIEISDLASLHTRCRQ